MNFFLGITSISLDLFKYGMSPFGASAILYRNKELRCAQYYVNDKWKGGVYLSSTLSPRNGAILSGTWFALVYNGFNKFILF